MTYMHAGAPVKGLRVKCQTCGAQVTDSVWNHRAQPASSEEPVAWRYKDSRGNWRYVGNKPNLELHPILEPLPLYAHPAAHGDAVLVPRALVETIIDTSEDGFIDYQIVARLRALLGGEEQP
jgi:hypothetical protein